MPRYRKKPVVIEAQQLIDDLGNHMGIAHWIHENGGKVDVPGFEPCLYIETPEGRMRADIGDYVIRGVKGEFYPCKPDIFEATYEPAEPTTEVVIVFRSGNHWGVTDDGVHRYLSTACLHAAEAEAAGDPGRAAELHGHCGSMVGFAGVKRPAQCKWCESRCVCGCHGSEGNAS